MDIGIYKIENLINHKIYIGQSTHIKKRWKEHCRYSANSLIARAIKKYGKDNFSFSIIELTDDVSNLNELEAKYIRLYNSLIPNGYNITIYDDREHYQFNTYDSNAFQQMIIDIKLTTMSFESIATKYNVSSSLIYYINRGDCHRLPNEQYPLRTVKDFSKQHHFCTKCGVEIKSNSLLCRTCSSMKQQKTQRPNRNELKQLIKNNSFLHIAKKFGVSDNTIRKWCKSYGLPYKRNEIDAFSDLAWQEI